ncbi:MAG: metal dependent phosphohydrolase, partial [Cyanobacteria bacterium RYN_339]|nr:metal dependent phosphohydrolase [Cyanobacteria bacterium RYN_339]
MHLSNSVIIYVAGLGFLVLAFLMFFIGIQRWTSASRTLLEAEKLKMETEGEADRLRSEALLEAEKAKQKALAEVETVAEKKDAELREHRAELKRQEKRVIQKEESLEKKQEHIEGQARSLQQREHTVEGKEREIDEQRARVMKELERISGLSAETARQQFLKNLEDELRHEAGVMIRDAEATAKEQADKKAREIITTSIQRCAVDHTVDATVTVVSLPSDEMKGRIIGREGRNIRALEAATGIDLIIDDTPEAVILSSFDPVRREVARITLERLIADGRIHPTRIDEVVEKARQEVDAKIKEDGENACIEAQVQGVHPEVVRVLGR